MKSAKTLLDYFYYSTHGGRLQNSEDVFFAKAGREEQGALVYLYLRINQKGIEETRFLAYGSATLIGGAEYLCSILEGKTIAFAKNLTYKDIASVLQITEVNNYIAHLLIKVLKTALEKLPFRLNNVARSNKT